MKNTVIAIAALALVTACGEEASKDPQAAWDATNQPLERGKAGPTALTA